MSTSIIQFISAVFSTLYLRYASYSNITYTNKSDDCFRNFYDIESPSVHEDSTVVNILPPTKYSLGYDLENEEIDVVKFDWKRNISF